MATYDKTSSPGRSRGFEGRTEQTIENGDGLAHSISSTSRISGAARELREQSRGVLKRGKAKAVQTKDGIESTISGSPWSSVLIAAGVGVAIGYALRRSR